MQTVLFDLDGTLLDTAPTFSNIVNAQLSRAAHPSLTVEEMRYRVSRGGRYMVTSTFESLCEQDELETLYQEFLAVYERDLAHLTTPLPGIVEMISALETRHIPWGIITNKKEAFTLPLLKHFDFVKNAATIVCGDTTPEIKPHPKPLLAACDALQVDATDCFYVGDAITDIQAGQRAGMKTIVADFGYIPPDTNLASWKADYIAKHPLDIVKITAGELS